MKRSTKKHLKPPNLNSIYIVDLQYTLMITRYSTLDYNLWIDGVDRWRTQYWRRDNAGEISTSTVHGFINNKINCPFNNTDDCFSEDLKLGMLLSEAAETKGCAFN